jgi:acyl-CoA thioesterase-2
VTDPFISLLELLDVEPIEVNIFRGVNSDETRQRVFGGQVAAQALVAAGRTVDRGRVHSLHSYFLRPGDPLTPILYEVDRIRDGRSFITRRVVAIQHGKAIFNLQCSFHTDEESVEHQLVMPAVPNPESLPTLPERLKDADGAWGGYFDMPRPIDQRFIGDLPWATSESSAPETHRLVWLRADGRLPDDPLLHAAVVAYASDMTLYASIVRPHRLRWADGSLMGASLDHCMWFHRPFRADEWLLFDQESPAAAGGRGVSRGLLFTQHGDLVVSVVQEGLIRIRAGEEPLSAAPRQAEASRTGPSKAAAG